MDLKNTAFSMRILFIAGILLLAFSCKSQKETASESTNQSDASAPDTVVLVVEKPQEPKDSLVISFDKTPCFGRCPTYKVKVYASGFATYEGLNFSERMGLYSTRFTPEQIDKIYQAAKEIGYFNLKSEYNDPLVTDLPSTISRIHYNGEDKRIMARMNVPEKLKIFHENLAVSLLEKDWKPYSNR